ncbi:MAG: 2-C-methyl-D-erythritol 4-phosphate cytidylyltransferase [Eubacteriales bacterium]|nr:2-C-methyl-D-erythritol 4-phosphate cytidylyltransferase [Eubacteriales bacterium]
MGEYLNGNRKLFTSCILVAAGTGSRMRKGINKQFICIGGMPMLSRTIHAFDSCSGIDEIIVVMNKADIDKCKREIVEPYSFKKVTSIVEGGKTRQESGYRGIGAVSKNADIVIVHDGARPFIDHNTILRGIAAAAKFGASCTAVPAKDTIKQSDSNGFVVQTPDRRSLWQVQTPQTFRYGILKEAHENAIEEGFTGTDDSMLVERMGNKLKLIEGNYYNIKITTEADLLFAEAIAKSL